MTNADVTYVIRIESASLNTPITLADTEGLTNRRVVGYRNANWYLLAEDTVTAPAGTAAQIALDCLANQTVAELAGDGTVRVRVWQGADPDASGTEPDAEVYDEPTREEWLDRVREATATREAAERHRDEMDTRWREVVAAAMRAPGVSRLAIAAEAGITKSRAFQIRDGKR